jgi:hypothetical protein
MNIYFWIISFFGLIVFYIVVLYEKQDGKTREKKALEESKNKDNQNTSTIEENNNLEPLTIAGISVESIKTGLGFIILTSIILGFIIYFGEKRDEYGKNFRFDYFLLGKPKCRGYSQQIPITTALEKAFYIK